ncbi:MAG: aspartate aminotransferase family protein [Gammaproteobacteria bacterium]|nr:aspartate aminotransferase family protein [Gammaproteobacteria bacterium]
MAVRGDGMYIVDAAGKRYLDACGGAAVSCLGHSDRTVIDAIKGQLDRLPYAHTSFFTNEPMEALADALIANAPVGLSHVYFVSGGSEAVEAALKLARQYFVESGQPQRRHVIARLQSYHGNTLGALATGGNVWRRQQYEPLLFPAQHVSPCYAYRGKSAGESDEAYGARLADELDATIRTLGPDSVMAFCAETVVGATLGAVPPVPGYFSKVREICDRHGVMLILDEVMCGMGRTGTLYACEAEGVTPDIVCVAKGLGAGYQPIGAAIVSAQIVAAIREGTGFFQHGHTYLGHAAACAGALAVQNVIRDRDLLGNVRRMGELLGEKLRARFDGHANVGDVRGRGLFWGLEFVRDRETKEPFDPALRLHARLKSHALERGLMCYPMGGTLDGRRGDHVLLAPPFIMEAGHADEIAEILAAALEYTLAQA